MDRLTKKNEKLSRIKGIPHEKFYYKLQEYEDFMEEQRFESLEELQNAIGFPRFVDGYDKDGNEINKTEFIRYKDELSSQLKDKKKLMDAVLIFNNRWQKMKEFVDIFADETLELINNCACDDLIPAHKVLIKVKEKIQELENGSAINVGSTEINNK